jgi:hypothetical protein
MSIKVSGSSSPDTQPNLLPSAMKATSSNLHKNQLANDQIPTACFDPEILAFFGGYEAVDKFPRLPTSSYTNRDEPHFQVKKEAIRKTNFNSPSSAIAVGRDGWNCPFIRINFAERKTPRAPVLFTVIYGFNVEGKIKWYLNNEEFSASHPDYEFLKRIINHTDAVYKQVSAKFRE